MSTSHFLCSRNSPCPQSAGRRFAFGLRPSFFFPSFPFRPRPPVAGRRFVAPPSPVGCRFPVALALAAAVLSRFRAPASLSPQQVPGREGQARGGRPKTGDRDGRQRREPGNDRGSKERAGRPRGGNNEPAGRPGGAPPRASARSARAAGRGRSEAPRELRTRAHAPTSDGSHRATVTLGAATPELR
jgi:hypothetical protein